MQIVKLFSTHFHYLTVHVSLFFLTIEWKFRIWKRIKIKIKPVKNKESKRVTGPIDNRR